MSDIVRNAARPTFRKPVPPGVVELAKAPVRYVKGLLERNDRSLIIFGDDSFHISTDQGLTWGEGRQIECGGMKRAASCIRLHSGELALAFADEEGQYRVAFSGDEGAHWSASHPMDLLGWPYYDTLIQLGSGRLLMPSRICFANAEHPGMEYERASTWGRWKGLPVQVSGHYHYPEMDIGCVSYSDDGRPWQQCPGKLMGWFDAEGIPNGRGGVTACDEPSAAETADGRVLFVARSTVGRLVACSSADRGRTWSPVRPTELACSYSPPRVRRIPETGDLLCVWNQVSREEILRGYRRGRLSAALSKDGGYTWQDYKTLEVSAGIEDVDRVDPQLPVTPIVGLPDIGTLPDDFSTFDYPNVRFAGDKVFVSYLRGWVEETPEGGQARTLGERVGVSRSSKARESVLRIYPLKWFYE